MSSSKQAELRRLMKLQREKKEQEKQVKHIQQPKSILRRKQQNNSPHQNNNALSSLLTAYSDDNDSDNSQEESKKKVVFADEPGAAASAGADSATTNRGVLETTHEIPRREQHRSEQRYHAKEAKNWLGMIQAADMDDHDEPDAVRQDKTTATREESPADDLADEQWKEFEALVGDDDDNNTQSEATESARVDLVDSQTASNEVEEAVASSSALAAAAAEPAGDALPDEQDEKRPSTTEVEQTSYEARIAKLRLKALQRRNKKAPAASSNDLSFSLQTYYTPELALSQEEETDTESFETSKKRAADPDNLTPLEILRQKRARARRELADEDDEV